MDRRAYVIGFALIWQLCWFLVVAGAASEIWPASLSLAALLLAVHLAAQGRAVRAELPTVALAAATGLLGDSLLSLGGLVDYRADLTGARIAPLWILMLWVWFACALHHPLRFLQRRPLLGAALGALAGPAAYLGGERLGAIGYPAGTAVALAGVGILYALAVPMLARVARATAMEVHHA